LERRNNELRYKLRDFKATSREKFRNFRNEMNHDFEELGEAFREFASDDVKD
jgi:hypothetical protein